MNQVRDIEGIYVKLQSSNGIECESINMAYCKTSALEQLMQKKSKLKCLK